MNNFLFFFLQIPDKFLELMNHENNFNIKCFPQVSPRVSKCVCVWFESVEMTNEHLNIEHLFLIDHQ